jgi:hypothetical protein
MDEIFSYWPIIFFIIAIFSRIIRNVNKDKNVIKKSKVDTKPLNEEQNISEEIAFDKDDNIIKQNKENISETKKTKQKEKKQIKKIQVKNVKKTNNKVIFRNKDDIIRGIIVKEVLDKPKFMD